VLLAGLGGLVLASSASGAMKLWTNPDWVWAEVP